MTHIAIEKYIKQLGIEAETMVSMARNQILPAALKHQQQVAEAIGATKAAGVDNTAQADLLRVLTAAITELQKATNMRSELRSLAAQHELLLRRADVEQCRARGARAAGTPRPPWLPLERRWPTVRPAPGWLRRRRLRCVGNGTRAFLRTSRGQ